MTPSRLSEFIRTNMDSILVAWENFARTIEPPALVMNDVELRDHAQLMLTAIAEDLNTHQSNHDRLIKSEGRTPAREGDTAAEKHAEARLLSGYTAVQLVSEYRALRASVLSLWGESGKTIQDTDIEDMTRFNEGIDQALAESVARYEKLVNQSRDMFLAILGHDLRNPLSALVTGSSNIMHCCDAPQNNILTANRMYNSARRMNCLVTDLVEFARMHLGPGIPIKVRESDVVQLCSEVIEELRLADATHLIRLQTPTTLVAKLDPARFSQLISNLLGNAIQHGDVKKPIVVTLENNNANLIMQVNNQGPPIHPEKISCIFNPLIRGEAERANIGGSLGIGLFIAKETAHAHGGKINVASNQQEGTTFTVTLPLGIK